MLGLLIAGFAIVTKIDRIYSFLFIINYYRVLIFTDTPQAQQCTNQQSFLNQELYQQLSANITAQIFDKPNNNSNNGNGNIPQTPFRPPLPPTLLRAQRLQTPNASHMIIKQKIMEPRLPVSMF